MTIDGRVQPNYVMRGGLTVDGTGSVAAAADQATVTLGVEVLRADAGEAFRVAGSAVADLLRVLTDHGVDGSDARTADVTLGPRFDYADGTQTLAGYQATQRIVVSVRDLAGLGALLTAAAVAAEGVRIDGVALVASRAREVGADARTAAMIDAREKAMSLAALAGRPLGPVVAVTEVDREPGPRPIALASHKTAEVPMPIALGETTVSVSVRVRFDWAD